MKIETWRRWNLLLPKAVALLVFGVAAMRAAGQDEPARSLEELAHEHAERMFAEAASVYLETEEKAPDPALEMGAIRPALPAQKMGTPGFVCLPTCDPTDAKFLAIASGSDLVTLSDTSLEISIGVPAGTTTFQLGFFDGDGAELDEVGDSRWDLGNAALFRFTLFADPLLDGLGSTVIPGFPVFSDTMPNNDWIDFAVTTSVEAQAPSGNYFYRLEIEMIDVAVAMINLFKVRTDGVVSIELFSQPFSYMSNFTSLTDVDVLFPNAAASGFTDPSCVPDATRTCYDGEYRFFFDVPDPGPSLVLWDGDLDRGSFDGTNSDTDDPNTVGQPPFATVDTADEGVAIGTGGSTGNPADDFDPTGFGIFFVEPPPVRYDVIFPDGQTFPNENPSGNQEWEKFEISTAPFDPALIDFTAPVIPPGTYELRIEGVDNSNLNAVRFPFRVLCVDIFGVACDPLRPFLVGDRVFLDPDKDGLQEPGEEGIAGVVVHLLNSRGNTIEQTTTNGDGEYFFEVDPGTFTVRVAAENFDAGNALEGLFTTTGGEEVTGGVTDDNHLDFDFGYRGTGRIGNFVWYDQNADGIDDEPASAGIAGVTVKLTQAGNDDVFGTADDVIFPATTTGENGDYEFTELLPGTYRVDVDESTLPAGVELTSSDEPLVVHLGPGEEFADADFGYSDNAAGRLGDVVWFDVDTTGAQESGEPGIDGATVRCEGDIDSDGIAEIILSTVTATVSGQKGVYGFNDLPPGSYSVTVDDTTLPAGLTTPTFDADGISTAGTVIVILGNGEDNDAVDFGYRGAGSAGDRVWLDANFNTLQDDGATGLNGAAVTLVGSTTGLLLTAVTSGDGNYSFANLAAETYTVSVDPGTLPPGLVGTFDADGITTANTAEIDLSAGENDTAIDFGYVQSASIGDRIWLDTNANGLEDDGASGFTGVGVRLLGAGHTLIATAITIGDGIYLFEDLLPGTYTVQVDPADLPPGVIATFDVDGAGTVNEAVVTVDPGEEETGADFGYTEPASVGDRVWNDLDGDGLQDDGEPGFDGVTAFLLDAGGVSIATAVTSGDGDYSFAGLLPGTYTVVLDTGTLPSGVAQTFDLDGLATANRTTVTLASGQEVTAADFGYARCNACDGKVTELTLLYQGDSTAQVEIRAKRGPRIDVVWNAPVEPNEEFTITGLQSGNPGFFGTLGTEIRIFVDGRHRTTIHTSCSEPVGPGLISGDFKVLAGKSRHGGLLCPLEVDPGDPTDPPPTKDCGCEGRVSELMLQYLGAAESSIRVVGKRGSTSDVLFEASVAPGEVFHVTSTPTDIPGFEGTLGTEIDILVDDQVGATIHTSCSEPVGPGLLSGDFLVVSGFSKEGGQLCPTAGDGFEFCVLDPPADEFHVLGSSDHVLWLPGISTALEIAGDGAFIERADGTASFTGTAVNRFDPGERFVIDVEFTGLTRVSPAGSPKKQLAENAYVENGGPVDTATWHYYTAYEGTLTGAGGWAGAVVQLSRTGPAFQVGHGASGFNVGFGASGWFLWALLEQPDSGDLFPAAGEGDFNVDLAAGPCPDCQAKRVRDDFDSVSFSGTSGPDNWSGPWIEDDPKSGGAGPGAGQVKVTSDGFLRLDDYPDTGGQPSAAREADLAGAVSATLFFDFDTSAGVDTNDAVTVEVSADGGGSWTTLEVITGIRGESWQARSFDISNYISSRTQVRFRVSNKYGGSNEFFYVGYVEILSACDSAPRGSIGGTVWNDANGNGIQEDPSTGISGVKVELLQEGDVLAFTMTDSYGHYSFDEREAGSYETRVDTATLPAGIASPTFDLDGIDTPGRSEFFLEAGQQRSDVSFGYMATSGTGAPCSACDHYTGSLQRAGDREVEPDGTYYYSEAGRHQGWLEGPGATDFDLALYKWNGSSWSLVASSSGWNSSEHVDYSGSAGYYLWRVASYSGGGDYDFWLEWP